MVCVILTPKTGPKNLFFQTINPTQKLVSYKNRNPNFSHRQFFSTYFCRIYGLKKTPEIKKITLKNLISCQTRVKIWFNSKFEPKNLFSTSKIYPKNGTFWNPIYRINPRLPPPPPLKFFMISSVCCQTYRSTSISFGITEHDLSGTISKDQYRARSTKV